MDLPQGLTLEEAKDVIRTQQVVINALLLHYTMSTNFQLAMFEQFKQYRTEFETYRKNLLEGELPEWLFKAPKNELPTELPEIHGEERGKP